MKQEEHNKVYKIIYKYNLIKMMTGITNKSCAKCKDMILVRIKNKIKITPDGFCPNCKLKFKKKFEELQKIVDKENCSP